MTKDTTKQAAPAKTSEAKAEADKPKATRKMLTPEEKIAKLEADLQAARAKVQEKDRKRFAEVTDKMTSLQTKRDEITKQLEELAGERDAIVQRVPELVGEQIPAEL